LEKTVCLDTGPLVSFFNKRDRFHNWVMDAFNSIDYKFITSESVITEVLYLTGHAKSVLESIEGMVNDDILMIKPVLADSVLLPFKLLHKFHHLPASMADVSLIVLYEQYNSEAIISIDSDFLVYRNSKGKVLKLISPFS
jgi:uncharacterized protein